MTSPARLLFLSLLCIVMMHNHVSVASPPWKSWTFCKKVDASENNVCLIKAIQGVEKDLMHGNSYFGTPPMDPLHIDELSMFKAGKDEPIAVNITFKNCDIIGLGSWQLYEIRSDWKNGDMMGKVHMKQPIQFISDYNINGKIILLPITGSGKSNITFEDMDVVMKMKMSEVQKKNKKYVTVDKFGVELLPKNVKVDLENLFNGNKALGDNMNKFLNENWKEIMDDVKKPISEALGLAFKQLALRVFAKIPMDTLVPN